MRTMCVTYLGSQTCPLHAPLASAEPRPMANRDCADQTSDLGRMAWRSRGRRSKKMKHVPPKCKPRVSFRSHRSLHSIKLPLPPDLLMPSPRPLLARICRVVTAFSERSGFVPPLPCAREARGMIDKLGASQALLRLLVSTALRRCAVVCRLCSCVGRDRDMYANGRDPDATNGSRLVVLGSNEGSYSGV